MLAGTIHARGRTGRADADVAAVTGWSALALLGVHRSAPTRAQVAIPEARRVTGGPRLQVIRSRRLSAADITSVHGVPTMRAAPALRVLAGDGVSRERLTSLAIDVLQAGATTLAELDGLASSTGRFPGRGRLSDAVTSLRAAGRTDSPLELRARRVLGSAGIPLDRGQVPVTLPDGGRLHLDLGIAAIRFGIEVDSFAWHSKRSHLDADARRSNVVSALGGWRVLRLTWSMIETGDELSSFLADVRQVVATQAQYHLGVPWPRPTDVVA